MGFNEGSGDLVGCPVNIVHSDFIDICTCKNSDSKLNSHYSVKWSYLNPMIYVVVLCCKFHQMDAHQI